MGQPRKGFPAVTIISALLDLYTNTTLFAFSIGELLTGLHPRQQLDVAAEYVSHPNAESAGVLDTIVHSLSS